MGGAYTAVGGDIDAIFYNPAGLNSMTFRIEVINPLVEADETAIDAGQDIIDALDLNTDTERLDEITRIINENMGEPLHMRISLFPFICYKDFAIGVLGQGVVDARLHNALSSSGAIEVNGGVEFGPVAGFSFPLSEKLRMGISGKWIQRTWVDEIFTAQQLAAENFEFEDFDTTDSDFSFDTGLLYSLPLLEDLNPVLGIALLDITDLDFAEGGKIPMRLNVGLSISPELELFSSFLVALDYEDVTNAFPEDDSTWKRVHIGAEVGLLKNHLFLRGGINQGYPAVGVDINIWLIKLGYAYYTEEVGAFSGQDGSSRHLVKLVIGW
jgi:hypothetical protein